MIELEFEYNKKDNWLGIHPKDKNYSALWKISNWAGYPIGYWRHRSFGEVQRGTYKEGDTGLEAYLIGIENSPEEIWVMNCGPAHVFDTNDSSKGRLSELSLDELEDFLTQMQDCLVIIGRSVFFDDYWIWKLFRQGRYLMSQPTNEKVRTNMDRLIREIEKLIEYKNFE